MAWQEEQVFIDNAMADAQVDPAVFTPTDKVQIMRG